MFPFATSLLTKGGSSTPFIPSHLTGLQAWWDVDTNLNYYSGANTSQVASWTDRVGSRALTPPGVSNSIYGLDTLNGHPILTNQVDADENWMNASYSHTGTAFTLALILSNYDGGDNFGRYISFGNSGISNDDAASGLALIRDGLTNGMRMPGASGMATAMNPGYFTYAIWIAVFDGTNVSAWHDGTQVGSTGTHSASFNFNRVTLFAEGDSGNPGASGRGRMADIITLHRAVTTAERQKLEGYLAHKFAQTSKLPSGHPYKTTAPTT